MSATYSQRRISLHSAALFGVVCGILRQLSEQPWLESSETQQTLLLPSFNAFTLAMLFFAYCTVTAWHTNQYGEQSKISAAKLGVYLALTSLAMGVIGNIVAWAWAMAIQVVL